MKPLTDVLFMTDTKIWYAKKFVALKAEIRKWNKTKVRIGYAAFSLLPFVAIFALFYSEIQ